MTSADPYLTLAAPATVETRVRGSTFIALAAPAADDEAARAVLAAVQREHHDATHNCSAWRLHTGVWRANDAGEPSGSAGAPILAAIDGAGVLDAIVVVTRYFGGTKLGVGGLVRAYGEAAAAALEDAPRARSTPSLRLRVRYPYEHTSAVMRAVEHFGAEELEHGFADGGDEAETLLTIPRTDEAGIRVFLRERTGGAVTPETLDERVLHRPVS